ncbi:MAG: energy transducer TonB [Opitutales bacterium]
MESTETFKRPEAGSMFAVSILVGVAFSFFLFVVIALAQQLSADRPRPEEGPDNIVFVQPPDVDIEEEEEVIEEEEPEPEPELDAEPPQLNLSALDINLDAGIGSGFAIDTGLPEIGSSQEDLDTSRVFSFAELDEPPRMLDASPIRFSQGIRARNQGVSGTVVLFLKIDASGNVVEVRSRHSSLPGEVTDAVLRDIESRRFSPPRVNGSPVSAQATLPVNIKFS